MKASSLSLSATVQTNPQSRQAKLSSATGTPPEMLNVAKRVLVGRNTAEVLPPYGTILPITTRWLRHFGHWCITWGVGLTTNLSDRRCPTSVAVMRRVEQCASAEATDVVRPVTHKLNRISPVH